MNYTRYRDDLEKVESDEKETQQKIIDVMSDGQRNTQKKYDGRAVRISHAKAHAIVKGELIVEEDLPPELAQGLFANAQTYPVVVRFANSPGELVDDSKVSAPRGIAIKVFEAEGAKLSPFEDIETQDFLLNNGKEFIVGGVKAFLQAFKPNAEIATKLSDTVKGVVSDVSRGTNAVLSAVGFPSDKLDFYGHPKLHPLAEPYYSQTPFRYGDYVAKVGVVPASPKLRALIDQPFDPETYNALREAAMEFFRTNPAEFDFVVQLNTDLEKMPIEDPTVPWPEKESPYRKVARLVLPAQNAYENSLKNEVEGDYSFSPAHTLEAHRPLGGINRARLTVYTAMAERRRRENNRPIEEPVSREQAIT